LFSEKAQAPGAIQPLQHEPRLGLWPFANAGGKPGVEAIGASASVFASALAPALACALRQLKAARLQEGEQTVTGRDKGGQPKSPVLAKNHMRSVGGGPPSPGSMLQLRRMDYFGLTRW
jgi:hypothetical protein